MKRISAALAVMLCAVSVLAGCTDKKEAENGSSVIMEGETPAQGDTATTGESASSAISVSEEISLDERNEGNADGEKTESVTTKVTRGVVLDATMNGITILSEDAQVMTFVYDMEVPVDDKDLADGVRLGMGIEIAYTGSADTTLVAVKESDAETVSDREALMEAGQLIFEIYNGYDDLGLSDAAKEAVLKTNLNTVEIKDGKLVLGNEDGPGITMERIDYVWTPTDIRP